MLREETERKKKILAKILDEHNYVVKCQLPTNKFMGLHFQFSLRGWFPIGRPLLGTERVRLVDIGRTSLSRGFAIATYLAAACLQQRLTPYSLACRQAHAVEGDEHGVRDSTVLSITECLTLKGSLSVPQNSRSKQVLKTFSSIPPMFLNMGFLGGVI
jgi:hypothetical protein